MTHDFWKRFLDNQFVPFALIVSVGFVIAAFVIAFTALHIKGLDNTLSVTGSAKTTVTADSVRLSFTISRTAPTEGIAGATTALDADLAKVQTFLRQNNVPESEVTISPVLTSQVYDGTSGAPTRYSLTRTITLNSGRVAELGTLAQSLGALAGQGVLVQTNSPEYYYTKLADLRVSLLGEALKDAKARANAIATESGQGVGRLQSSTSGVVQVLAPNTIDVSDYGQYDTSSVEKEVMITVRATFEIN